MHNKSHITWFQVNYPNVTISHLLTASRSRVFPGWPGPVPAAEPVCKPPRCVVATRRAAPRRGMGAAPAGGRSGTGTPGTDCAHRCSKGGEKENSVGLFKDKYKESCRNLDFKRNGLFF